MKILITIFILLCVFNQELPAQELEFRKFETAFNSYLDFLNRKTDSIPFTEANHKRLSENVNQSFKKFILYSDSDKFDKLVFAKNDTTTKFWRSDRVTINLKSFLVNQKIYVVYSIISRDKKDYYLKDVENNIIVHEGNSATYVNNLYAIDSSHFLIIEENGDYNSDRTAMVLSAKTQPWKIIKAFEGMAFGQVPGHYTAKKFVKKRDRLQLHCDMEFAVQRNQANNILFDPQTKTISYKQYFENKQPINISAKWNNRSFIIDDYDVSENLSSSPVSIPE